MVDWINQTLKMLKPKWFLDLTGIILAKVSNLRKDFDLKTISLIA